MKKALAFLSALAFASASQSEGFLSDNEMSIKPLPSRHPAAPFMLYADDEQYSRDQIEQSLHYPLQSFKRNHPEKHLNSVSPTLIQKERNMKGKSVEDSLYELKQIMKQGEKAQNQEKLQKAKLQPALDHAYYAQPPLDSKSRKDPRKIRHEYQHRSI